MLAPTDPTGPPGQHGPLLAPTGPHGSHWFSQTAPTLLSHMDPTGPLKAFTGPLKAFTGPHGPPRTVLWITLAFAGLHRCYRSTQSSLAFTGLHRPSNSTGPLTEQAFLHWLTLTPLAKPALHLNTIEAWVSQGRCIWMVVFITSYCFAFVIVMLLCVCYFTSSSFVHVFSLLLLCPAPPVSKHA